MAYHDSPSTPSELRGHNPPSSLPPGALDPAIAPNSSSAAPPPPPPRPTGEPYTAYGGHHSLAGHYGPTSERVVDDFGALNIQRSANTLPPRPDQVPVSPSVPMRPGRDSMARKPLPTPPGALGSPHGAGSQMYQQQQQASPQTRRGRALPVPPSVSAQSHYSPDRPLPRPAANSPGATLSHTQPNSASSSQQQGRPSSVYSTSTAPTTAASSFFSHTTGTSHTEWTGSQPNSAASQNKYPSYDEWHGSWTRANDAYGGEEQSYQGQQQENLQSISERPAVSTHVSDTSTPHAGTPEQRSYLGDSHASSSGHTKRAVSPLPQVDFPTAQPAQAPASAVPDGREQRPGASSSNLRSQVEGRHDEQSPSWAADSSRPWVQTKLLLHQSGAGGDYYYEEDLYDDYGASSLGEEEIEEEMNEIRFFNPAYLSETAVQVRDRVIRGHHVKGGITWVGTFTGKDLIATIQSLLPSYTRDGPSDHRFALWTARSLHSQLWVVEVDWDLKPIRDSPDVVFKFMSEMEGMQDVSLPKGVLTMATKCYAPSCTGDGNCYAPRCPHKSPPSAFLTVLEDEPTSSRAQTSTAMVNSGTDWAEAVDPVLLASLSDLQRERQTLIHAAILQEEQYEADLAALETVFIAPLLTASPPIVQPYAKLDQYRRVLFGNVTDIRRASRRLLDNFGIRMREQAPLIDNIGDIFLEATTEFRALYPTYTDNLPQADLLLNEALLDPTFATWIEKVSRSGDHRWDLRYLLKRPATYLQYYPETIAGILKATPGDHPDYDFLHEALSAIQNISYISQLKLYHAAKGRGPNSTLKWHDIVSAEVQESMPKKEMKRQMQIWELIQGEMLYVQDLEAIDTVFVNPLRNSDKQIIPRSRLDTFIDEVFHNYRSLLDVHRGLLAQLEARQIEQHPNFGMVSDLFLNAALNWHEAYLEYMPNYPLSKAKIDAEKASNPAFVAFLDECLRNPLAERQDITHYTYRPIGRLLRYPLLLKEILASQEALGPEDHPDCEAIPQIIDLIEGVAKAGQKGVAVNSAKVDLWHLKTTLNGGKFGPRSVKELDLLNPMRELIHKGKVYRQPEGTISGAWSELHLLLFDNYFVLVKQTKVSSRHKDAPPQFSINRRPVPLELLSMGDFSQPAQNRSLGLLKTIRGAGGREHEGEETQSDSRTVYPFTYSFIGQGAGQYTLWTDSSAARQEWRDKIKHAKVLRDEVNSAGQVFEFETLSTDTFYVAPYGVTQQSDEYTGRVTCSVPFVTVDGRSLVAVGCEQGVWIGVRKDPQSLRKVLHVRSVTKIAVLEEFGIFLVLADRSLLAYNIEALVPTAQSPQVRTAPERLSGVRDIVFFAVGQISGRTLVLYVKHKGTQSVFRVLEPIHFRERGEPARRGFGMILGQRTEWFREYKLFYIPTEAQNVHFLNTKLAIVCARGFEIMDLTDLKGGAIPTFSSDGVKNNPRLAELKNRHDTTRPLAMFRSTNEEFLLCYATFGMYVNRYGEPNRDMQPIEWEGTPDSVVFHPPYILLVSPSFIEVRHIDTAKLLQIYTGSDMRCTWDGTGARRLGLPGPSGWGEEVTDTSPRLHICKRAERPGRTKGIGQHLYELVPTLLLNNPLLNPTHTTDPNYFPPAPETSLGTAPMMSMRVSSDSPRHSWQPDAPLSNGYTPSVSQLSMSQRTIAHDRRSVSSVSTATLPNSSPYTSSPSVVTGTAGGFPTPSPARRVSDQSYLSSQGGTSGFASVGGFTAVDDYSDYGGHRSRNPHYDTGSLGHRQPAPGQPQSAASQYAQLYGQPGQPAAHHHSQQHLGYQDGYQNSPGSRVSSYNGGYTASPTSSISQASLPPRGDSYGNGGRPRTSAERLRDGYQPQQQYRPLSGYQAQAQGGARR